MSQEGSRRLAVGTWSFLLPEPGMLQAGLTGSAPHPHGGEEEEGSPWPSLAAHGARKGLWPPALGKPRRAAGQ